jgi:hypothetical protein
MLVISALAKAERQLTAVAGGCAFLCLLSTFSCPAENSIVAGFRGEAAMGPDAGRGCHLIVNVRVEGGEEWPFAVDTGSAVTALDKSLGLTNRPYTVDTMIFGVYHEVNVCAAPKLYLGKTPLKMTSTNVLIYDFKTLLPDAPRTIRGIIGMDVLKHYCIQLDFRAGKMRVSDIGLANRKDWGRPYSLADLGDGCFLVADNLAGVKGPVSLVDTGCNYDGWLTSETFDLWTNRAPPSRRGEDRVPNGTWGDETYPEILHLRRLGTPSPYPASDAHLNMNGVGLHFLARHLVTLDFPNRTMYLKRTSVFALPPSGSKAALKLVRALKQKGQLPGWSKDEREPVYSDTFSYPDPQSVIVILLKDGHAFRYYYTITRASADSQWKLTKAWRTDEGGRTIEQYAVH